MKLWPDVVRPGAPPKRAACFVDMRKGKLAATQFNRGGWYTTWTIPTNSDPQLRFLSGDRTVTVTLPSTLRDVPLSDGLPGVLVLRNSAVPSILGLISDSRNDFALNYLLRDGGIPASFSGPLPGPEDSHVGRGNERIDMTPSCSNSQYP